MRSLVLTAASKYFLAEILSTPGKDFAMRSASITFPFANNTSTISLKKKLRKLNI